MGEPSTQGEHNEQAEQTGITLGDNTDNDGPTATSAAETSSVSSSDYDTDELDHFLLNYVFDNILPIVTKEQRETFIPLFEVLFPETNLTSDDYQTPPAPVPVNELFDPPKCIYRVFNQESEDPTRPPFIWVGFENMLDVLENQRIWDVPLPVVSPSSHYIGNSTIPGAGKGIFAAKNIKAYETILIERPILLVSLKSTQIREALEELDKLPASTGLRDQFWSLANCWPSTSFSVDYGIVKTNQMGFYSPAFGRMGQMSGVGLQISRCNHR